MRTNKVENTEQSSEGNGGQQSHVLRIVNVSQIRTDGGARLRDVIDESKTREYARLIKEHVMTLTLTVFLDAEDNYWLADGFYQHSAAQQLGIKKVEAKIYSGSRRDAVFYAAGANARHGVIYTHAEKRSIIAMLLKDLEWGRLSASAIARHVGVDHKTVSAVKRDLKLSGEISPDDTCLVTRGGAIFEMKTAEINRARTALAVAEKQRAIEQKKLEAEDQERAANAADDAERLRAKWEVERGQVWAIESKTVPNRSHLIMCGDSSRQGDVFRLMLLERAQCMWTDPPYGVSYKGKTKKALTIQGDDKEGLEALLRGSFFCANGALVKGAAIYVAHPAGAQAITFLNCFNNQGWQLRQSLIWLKDSKVIGHSDYHYQHEPIIYGYKVCTKRRGRGSSGWHGDNNQSSVLDVARPYRSEHHPTMKPPELIAKCIRNSSPQGGLIYDPFAGSGSTILAAEINNRICYGMEIDPRYVAVVLERLSGIGLEARLVKQHAERDAA